MGAADRCGTVIDVTTRHQRAGIDDRWHKRVKGPDGKMGTERSAVYGKVSRWRVRWVDGCGEERTKSFHRKPDAQVYLNGLTADLQRGEYVDPRRSAETFGSVAEQWFATKQHRKPKTVAGYRSLLDTVVLPTWADRAIVDTCGSRSFSPKFPLVGRV